MELLNGILYLVLGLLVLIYFMNKCGCRRVEGAYVPRGFGVHAKRIWDELKELGRRI